MTFEFPFRTSLISSDYGPRRWNGVNTFHTGCDFAVAGNLGVRSAADGVVTAVEYTALKGYQLEITHNAALKTRYHMLRSDLSTTSPVGKPVVRGQIVGHVAAVRYSPNAAWTGPHLHFEVWLKTVYSNGTPYGSWMHRDPIESASNAGGSSGYYPVENGSVPTGGDVTPIEPTNPIEDDMFTDADRKKLTDLVGLGPTIHQINRRAEAIQGTLDSIEKNVLDLVTLAPTIHQTNRRAETAITEGRERKDMLTAILSEVRALRESI